jgi:hypothetical protein
MTLSTRLVHASSVFALALTASCNGASYAGDYQAEVTTAQMSGASAHTATAEDKAMIAQTGDELAITYGPCAIHVTKSGMKLTAKPGDSCTHTLIRYELVSGEGDIKDGALRLALVWKKDGATEPVNERVILKRR